MTGQLTVDQLLAEADRLADHATPGPWYADDSADSWQLFAEVEPFGDFNGIPLRGHPWQLLKAPKHGTPYAEYWPNEADAAFIARSRTLIPQLAAALRETQAENQRLTAEVEHSNEQLTAWAEEAQRADHRADHFQAENMRLRAKIERGSE